MSSLRISLHSIDDIPTGELIVELMSRGIDISSAIEQRKASAVRARSLQEATHAFGLASSNAVKGSPSAKRKANIVKFPNRRAGGRR
jgi:hypothetical protein